MFQLLCHNLTCTQNFNHLAGYQYYSNLSDGNNGPVLGCVAMQRKSPPQSMHNSWGCCPTDSLYKAVAFCYWYVNQYEGLMYSHAVHSFNIDQFTHSCCELRVPCGSIVCVSPIWFNAQLFFRAGRIVSGNQDGVSQMAVGVSKEELQQQPSSTCTTHSCTPRRQDHQNTHRNEVSSMKL